MPTALPCRGRITAFAEDSGWIETEHRTRVRFGRTSCSGFDPSVGLDVFVMATKVLPVVGERATLVNLTGAAEASDPAERARVKRETEQRDRREQHEAKRRAKEALRSPVEVPADWRAGLVSLGEVIELPPVLRGLSTVAHDSGEVIVARVAREQAIRAELTVDLVAERHHAAPFYDLCIGTPEPWPIQDACLVPFAQLDGEAPDLFAVFFHPALHRVRGELPVVYWRHEDGVEFVGADVTSTIAALVHGRFAHEEDGDLVRARPELAKRLGLADPGGRLVARSKFPAELALLINADAAERRATEELWRLSCGEDYAAVVAASSALEQRYRALGWRYHVSHTQHQRRRFLDGP